MPEETLDELSLQMMQELEKRKKELAELKGTPAWKTNCSFSFNAGDQAKAVNLHTVSSLSELTQIAGHLLQKKDSYNSASKLIGVEDAGSFTWNGYTFEDWIYDIKARAGKIQLELKQRKLDQLEKRIDMIISPELKRRLEIEALRREMGV